METLSVEGDKRMTLPLRLDETFDELWGKCLFLMKEERLRVSRGFEKLSLESVKTFS
jgi:hypothetical protein